MRARVEQQEHDRRRNVPAGAKMVEETHAEFSDLIEFG